MNEIIDILLRDTPAGMFRMFEVKIIWNFALTSYHPKEVFLHLICTNKNLNLSLKEYLKKNSIDFLLL
jgi:hypothetical protein